MKKNFKKLTAILLTIATIITVCAVSAAPYPFKDSVNHWGKDFIQQAYEDGVVTGMSGNPANGTGVFEPEGKLSYAQFAVIISNAFYPDHIEAVRNAGVPASYPWYYLFVQTLEDKNLWRDTNTNDDTFEQPINRYEMSLVVANTLENLGYTALSDSEISTVLAGCPDVNSDSHYARGVATAMKYNIIGGMDEQGSFVGNGTLTRAQACVIYINLKNAAASVPSNPQPSTPPTVDPQPQPTNPGTTNPQPSAPSGSLVGTVSDGEAQLSLSTHAPVVDYWSEAPKNIQNLTDKDMFNCFVATYLDRETIANGTNMKKGQNMNYNYACFKLDRNAPGQKLLISVTDQMATGYHTTLLAENYLTNADSDDVGIISFQYHTQSSELDEIFKPIFSKFPANATDKQKINIILQEMCDRFEYSSSGSGFFWTHGSQGVCQDYARAFSAIADAAGIPVLRVSGDVNHIWNLIYIEHDWYAVDVSTDPDPVFRLEVDPYAGTYGCENENDTIVSKYIIETYSNR